MAERYGLWDVESGNNLGFYPTQDAALAVVRQELRAYGRESVNTLALDRDDTAGGGLVAEGDGLIELAEATAPPVLPRQGATDGTAPTGTGRSPGQIVARRVHQSPRSAGMWQSHYRKPTKAVSQATANEQGKSKKRRKK